jgi:hypothetical protein
LRESGKIARNYLHCSKVLQILDTGANRMPVRARTRRQAVAGMLNQVDNLKGYVGVRSASKV